MAKEWYLMNTNHDMTGGFESDDFDNFAQDAFSEILESSIATKVEVCNYDLSERTPQKVVIQGKVQDTKLNSLSRSILAPIGTLKAGQYIYYKDRYWLIDGFVDDNGFYEKGIMKLCNYLLTWKNQKGKIVQRWANIVSASQYNNGETSNEFTFVRSDQLMVMTPQDDECLLMPHKQRFIIDKRCKIYEKEFTPDITCDTSRPLITYELTRMDNVLYDYQDSGHSEFMAYEDEQHENDGYYVIDGKGYWLCDEPTNESDNKTRILSCSIDYDEPIIYLGLEPSVFISSFYDSNGNKINVTPKWDINCDFVDDLDITYVDNSIYISVDNKKLLNKSFELSLCADGYEKCTITITIKAFM